MTKKMTKFFIVLNLDKSEMKMLYFLQALSVIDSAAKAHLKRRALLEKENHSDDDDHSVRSGVIAKGSDSGIDDAVSVIGAAARGHLSRKNNGKYFIKQMIGKKQLP